MASRSLYTRFISGGLFPFHERLKKHVTVSVRKHMEETQWWTGDRIRELQLERLRQFLAHCETRVPFYRQLFSDHGITADSVRSLHDLGRIPFLTKDIIREHTGAMKAADASGLARFNTGGSSGEPLVFYIGKRRVSHDVAAKWRATRWWNVDIGDPEIVVWGSPIELGSQDRIRAARDALLRTRLLSAFEMSAEKLDGFITEIRSTRPRMLFGYPSALAHIARHAMQRGQRMDDLGIRVAFVTSERLYDDQRDSIETVFNCPVANGYGGRDAGFIAHQCPEGGMHVTAEDIVVEIIGEDDRPMPPGAAGEIVITHLATHDFPFVRYRTGDVGVMDTATCSCGRGLPLMKEIQGRTTDFVVAADGTVMHGLALIYVLRDIPGIENFKIIQEDLHHLRVQLVAGEGFREEGVARIREGLGQRLGDPVEIRIERVNQIPAERSGKFRYVVSKVAGTHATAEEPGQDAALCADAT